MAADSVSQRRIGSLLCKDLNCVTNAATVLCYEILLLVVLHYILLAGKICWYHTKNAAYVTVWLTSETYQSN